MSKRRPRNRVVLDFVFSRRGALSAALAVFLTVGTGAWRTAVFLDARWAKAAEVEQLQRAQQQTHADILAIRRDTILSQLQALQRAARVRRLTDQELDEVDRLQRQIDRLNEVIKKLGGETP